MKRILLVLAVLATACGHTPPPSTLTPTGTGLPPVLKTGTGLPPVLHALPPE